MMAARITAPPMRASLSYSAITRGRRARHLQVVRAQHERDPQHGAGWVELPTALARKYPNAGREWVWHWVFPATRPYRDRTMGQWRRHHLHESVLQRVVKDAAHRARDHADLHARPEPRTVRREESDGHDPRGLSQDAMWPVGISEERGQRDRPRAVAGEHGNETNHATDAKLMSDKVIPGCGGQICAGDRLQQHASSSLLC